MPTAKINHVRESLHKTYLDTNEEPEPCAVKTADSTDTTTKVDTKGLCDEQLLGNLYRSYSDYSVRHPTHPVAKFEEAD